MAYSFEETKKSTRRAPDETHPDLKELKTDLVVNDETHDGLLLALVTQFPLNISWYRGRIKWERRKQWVFFLVSAGLLLAIPIVIYLFTSKAPKGVTITVQLTALLTGLIAFHNVVRHWLEARNGLAIFHEASSKLQTNFYEFIDKWRTKEKDAEFKKAVEAQLKFARDIVNEEQKKFFEKIATFPTIDLGAALMSAGQSAAGIIDRHRRKLTEQEVAQRKALQDVQVKEALTSGYDKLIKDQEATLKIEQDETEKAEIKKSIADARKAKRKVEEDLLKALAQLEKFS